MTRRLTFAGLPACPDIQAPSGDVVILGAPYCVSYDAPGPGHAADAPAAIRQASYRFAGMVTHYDFDLGGPLLGGRSLEVVDGGDIPGDPKDPSENRRRITGAIRAVRASGAVPLIVGGDDSVPIPVLAALDARKAITLLQIDAHIDWRNTVGGIKHGPSSPMRRASEMSWIKRMLQVGIRGVGSARKKEVSAARAFGSEIFTARQIHKAGVGPVIEHIPGDIPCVISIDCDALDPAIMPAVKAPLPGGLDYWQLIDLLRLAIGKTAIEAVIVTEFMPQKDPDGRGALTVARILWNTIGFLARSKG